MSSSQANKGAPFNEREPTEEEHRGQSSEEEEDSSDEQKTDEERSDGEGHATYWDCCQCERARMSWAIDAVCTEPHCQHRVCTACPKTDIQQTEELEQESQEDRSEQEETEGTQSLTDSSESDDEDEQEVRPSSPTYWDCCHCGRARMSWVIDAFCTEAHCQHRVCPACPKTY